MTTSPSGQVAGIDTTPGALTGAAMPGVATRAAIAAELAVTASSRRMIFMIPSPRSSKREEQASLDADRPRRGVKAARQT